LLSPEVAQDRRWKRILRVLFHLFLLTKGEQQWNCAEHDKQVYHGRMFLVRLSEEMQEPETGIALTPVLFSSFSWRAFSYAIFDQQILKVFTETYIRLDEFYYIVALLTIALR
jgi:hypothetical protein